MSDAIIEISIEDITLKQNVLSFHHHNVVLQMQGLQLVKQCDQEIVSYHKLSG